MAEFSGVPDSYQIPNLEHRGRFVSSVRNTHRKEQYSYNSEGSSELRILKFLPVHSAHSEVVGSAIFRELGLKAPETFYVEEKGLSAVIMEDLSTDYVPDLTYGEGGIMSDKNLKDIFKNTMLAAILIGDYDRVPWNTLIKRDFSGIAHVDFGACCGSRAQGGYNGFSDSIDIEDIRHVIADPYNLDIVSNTAYAEMINLDGGKINILDPKKLKQLSVDIGNLSDRQIDAAVDLSAWPDNNTKEGRAANESFLNSTIFRLKEDQGFYSNKKSRDYIKTARALTTFNRIKSEFGGDISGYFKHAIKCRRNSVVKIFG